MQNVNQITVPEREVPTLEEVADRVAQRLEVHLEHDLRHLSERERKSREEDLLPIVERLVLTDSGRRHLSALLYAHLRDKPEPAPEKVEVATASSPDPRDIPDPEPSEPREHDDAGPPRKKRRRRRPPRPHSA